MDINPEAHEGTKNSENGLTERGTKGSRWCKICKFLMLINDKNVVAALLRRLSKL